MNSRDTYERRFDEDVQQNDHNTCPECGGRVTINTRESVCDGCGLVLDDQRIDHGPEWRSFETDETNPERTGAPLTHARHDRGLSTQIGRKRDGNGSTLSSGKRRKLHRLRREHRRGKYRNKRERNLAQGCNEIKRLVSALGLSDRVDEEAARLFKRAQDENLLLGRSIETLAAGCVYAACRVRHLGRKPEDVAVATVQGPEKVLLGYRVLNEEVGIAAEAQRPREYIPRFTDECGLLAAVERRARELAKRAVESGIANGRKPSAVAAACIYKAGKEHDRMVTQASVADVAGTTQLTLRERYYELQDKCSPTPTGVPVADD